jgi:hypothetical protein
MNGVKTTEYPDLDEVTLIARKYGPEMIAGAVDIAQNSDSDATRLKAIDLVLTRGYGKAGAVKQQSVPNQLDHMSRDERIRALQDALTEEQLAMAQEKGNVA